MTDSRKLNLIRAAAFGFIGFLIAVVVVANRGEGTLWWPFLGEIPYGDKLGHIGLFGTLGFLCNLAFPTQRPSPLSKFVTKTTLVLLIIITLEELSQAFIPSRTMDPLDWLSDLAGLAIGQTFALLTLKASKVESRKSHIS